VEFHEKLQQLRKSRGLTQEELAQALYVSRTAVSKWESGRGYPSIDSLRELSVFFSITIDELLSGDRLLSIARQENNANIRGICDLLMGAADLLALSLIVLPLYANPVEGYVYAAPLHACTSAAPLFRLLCWLLSSALIVTGILKLWLVYRKSERFLNALTVLSLVLGILAVLLPALSREAYAVTAAFALLMIKGMLMLRSAKAGG